MTIEDLWAFRRLGAPAPVPGGGWVIVPVTTYDMQTNRDACRLWCVPAAGGEARPLTSDEFVSRQPAPGPDGRRLAFVRRPVAAPKEKPARAQLYVMPLDGGEAQRLTDLPLGCMDPRWFPDGRRIAFLAPLLADAPTPDGTRALIEAREKEQVQAHMTEDRVYRYWDRWLTDGEYPHLFVIDIETRALTDLTPDSRRWFDLMDPTGQFDIAPDGGEIAFSANASEPPHDRLNWNIFTVPACGGAVTCLTPENPADDVRPRYSPDGRYLLYGMQRRPDFYADRVRLVRLDRATGEKTVLTEDWDRSADAWEFSPDGATVFLSAEDRARVRLFRADIQGAGLREIHGAGSVSSLRVGDDARLYFLSESLSRPPDLHSCDDEGRDVRRLTAMNDSLLAEIEMGEVEERHFEGADGRMVQMFVVKPPGFDPSRTWPLVHVIHGGPHGITGDSFHFRWNLQLFAAPGYVVAAVNFHGSTSWGEDFAQSIEGAHGDKPLTDMMRATDALIAAGFIDEKRMAAAGGSYGGYLVSWIAGHTGRFACLVNHAGVSDLLGQYASDVTQGRSRAYGGEPWSGLEAIDRYNPARFSAGFASPMLVVHGENDYRVPYNQGLEIYNVYKAKGLVARLLHFPDENHWVLKPRNSRLWYREVHAWLARFLAG
jgi:dipeptidyl aminopeptidase/acylaminoacyl peptidase